MPSVLRSQVRVQGATHGRRQGVRARAEVGYSGWWGLRGGGSVLMLKGYASQQAGLTLVV